MNPPIPRWGDCSGEAALEGRTDIVMCEPWEQDDWWTSGYFSDPRTRREPAPTTLEHLEDVTVENDESQCVSGKCLRVPVNAGDSGHMSEHWLMANVEVDGQPLAPEHAFLRYYLRLGPTWTNDNCEGGEIVNSGGKLPGFADVRVNDSATGESQCGNGGASSDGLNCWSNRANFRSCGGGSFSTQVCDSVPEAIMRFGNYVYYGGQAGSTGDVGPWDDDPWGASYPGSHENPPCAESNNLWCGIGNRGVLVRDRWYAIETEIKMNTPGQEDGILRGWVDGELAYEKTNMVWREPGHDNLHVRGVWLNIYHGGVFGACDQADVWIDQMVIALDSPIGVIE